MQEKDIIYKINEWTEIQLRRESSASCPSKKETPTCTSVKEENPNLAELKASETPVSFNGTNRNSQGPPHSEELPIPGISHATSVFDLKTFYVPRRYIFVILGFFGTFFSFAMRVNLSVAIVAMVNQTVSIQEDVSFNQITEECPNPNNGEISIGGEKFQGEQYNWSPETQGVILGAYYYGYVITQLPGGILSEKIGAKWVFGGGMLLTIFFCLISPLAASWGTVAFTIVRALQGLSDGVTLPAINMAISTWSPKTERSRVSTVIFMGVMLGTVCAMLISGVLCSSTFLGGWPSVFYVLGFASFLWFLLWCFFVFESPSLHPSISREELDVFAQDQDEQSSEKSFVPWMSLIKSIPLWALLIAHTGSNFGFLIMLAEIPTYLSTVLHYDLASNGLLSALPFICQALGACIASFIADGLRQSNKMAITSIRKLMNSIGVLGPAICVIAITFSGCQAELIIALLCLSLAINGCVYSGYNCTHVDMCPANPGTLYAITNIVANLSGIIGPMIVSAFVANGATVENWSKVFYTTAAVYIVSGGIFAIFGSAELQTWGTVESDAKPSEVFEEKPNKTNEKTHL